MEMSILIALMMTIVALLGMEMIYALVELEYMRTSRNHTDRRLHFPNYLIRRSIETEAQSIDGIHCVDPFTDKNSILIGTNIMWRDWINACLRSSRSSVMINGSPTKEFRLYKGLRQGDPLSPFLFILAMEGLHVAMEDAISGGLFSPLCLGTEELNLSHLFYVDDALFLGEWSKKNVENLVCILHCFYLVSGSS
ncbi:hypothetical protein LXL04_008259 [Taraxacum kok-saghyz]